MYGSRRRQLQRLSSTRVPVGHRQRALCLQHRARRRTNYCSPYRCDRTRSGAKYAVLLPHTGNHRSGNQEDPARGMSEIRLGGITRSLWTYSRFLSKHPVRDTYGVIETPENAGLIPDR